MSKLRSFVPVVVLLACALRPSAIAQSTCLAWDASFGAPATVDTSVLASITFDDGSGEKLYVGGDFSLIDGVSIHYVARWDGTHWSPVGTGLPGTVQCFGLYDDGSGPALYAGGRFHGHVARWNGSAWSLVGAGLGGSTGAVGEVRALAAFDDGSGPALFAGGSFTSAGGVPAIAIARWNGSSWSGLPGALGGTSPEVYALAVHDEGSGSALYAGGTFTSAGASVARHIARWSGAQWSALGAGFDANVYTLTSFTDLSGPMLYAGGDFHASGSTLLNAIARWDGVNWLDIDGGLTTGSPALQPFAVALTVFDDGGPPALYVGGYFSHAGPVTTWDVAKWSGGSWSSMSSGVSSVGSVQTLSRLPGGRELFAGGSFPLIGNLSAKGIARWNGTAWIPIGHLGGFSWSGQAYAVRAFDDGTGPSLYVGGQGSPLTNTGARALARWNGSGWSKLGEGFPSPNSGGPRIRALEVYDAGSGPSLFAGGYFHGVGTLFVLHLARWNGTTWSSIGGPPGIYIDEVFSLCAYDLGSGPKLYVGGRFTFLNGVATPNIGSWNGQQWQALSVGVNGSVYAIAGFDDGTGPALYIGGTFSIAGGIPASRVARWNGSAFSAVGAGFDNHVLALAVYDDGSGPALYAGGAFLSSGIAPARRLARWNGTSWSEVGGGVVASSPVTPLVESLHVFDDGKSSALYVGGSFNSAGGMPAANIARWDGSGWSTLGSGANGSVHAIGSLGSSGTDGLYLGGGFSWAGDTDSSRVARWTGCEETFTRFCFGDGSLGPCPCGNTGLPQRGCDNSASTGGGRLTATGTVAPDTVELHAAGLMPNALAIFLQADGSPYAAVTFGDGLRCVSGSLLRLYTANASQGAVSQPSIGAPSVSAVSAALGDPLTPGAVRTYQTYYRDPEPAFCPQPFGDTWNVTSGVRIEW